MSARKLGGAAVVAFPLTILAGDFFRIRGEAGSTGDGSTVDSIVTQLAAVDAQRGLFEIASWLFYAAALLTIPMVLLLWRLSVDRAPRWAWAGGVLGALAVTGQIAHVMGYFGIHQALSTIDPVVGATAVLAYNNNGFTFAVFAPYLIGLVLFPPVQALALWRARVVPLWAVPVLVAGALVLVVGDSWWLTVVWCLALLVGFAPAVRLAFTRREAMSSAQEPALATS